MKILQSYTAMAKSLLLEDDDDRYVYVGGQPPVYKEKDSRTGEALPNSPSYLKKDSGGYEMVDPDDPRLSKGDDKGGEEEPKGAGMGAGEKGGEEEPKGAGMGAGDFERDFDDEKPEDDPDFDYAKDRDKEAEDDYRDNHPEDEPEDGGEPEDKPFGGDTGTDADFGGDEVERDKRGVPENEQDWAEEIDQVQSDYEEMKDNYEETKKYGDPDDPEEKEQMEVDRVEYINAKTKLRMYYAKEKEQGWDREMGRTGRELSGEVTINGKQYRPIKESKKITLKENYERLFRNLK